MSNYENLASKIGVDADAPEKIFITRPQHERRKLLNQSEVRDFFLGQGYVEVDPASLTFLQQVKTFSKAQCVAGSLGAECTNIVFPLKLEKFLGFAPETLQDDFYWDLVSQKNGKYYCLHGHVDDFTHDLNANFILDMDELRSIAREFEST